MPEATPVRPAPHDEQNRHFALFLLIIVYTLNFLDRQILSILAVPIKAEFGLSDAQLGWLGGLAFGALYSVLALPAAWLADRYSRTWIMTGALATWSACTALCGLATGYVSLFIARMGVGVGEAGGVAPAYSLISELYPPQERARALAIYSFGIPIGAASGVLFGGMVASTIDWRMAFIAIGIAGVVFAPVFRSLIREPKRPQTTAPNTPGLIQMAKLAFAKPSFWLLSLGAGSASLVGYGLMFWLPSFLVRSLGLSLGDTSQFLAAVLFFGGIIGLSLGGFLADRLGQRSKSAYAVIPAVAFLLSAPLYALGVFSTLPVMAFFLFLVPQALALAWLGPVLTAVQHLGPPEARSQMSALFLLIINLIGLGLGPYAFGQMSDLFGPAFGQDSIKWAFLSCLGFYPVAAVLLFLAAKRLPRDWVD